MPWNTCNSVSGSRMQTRSLDYPTFGIGERVHHHEGLRVKCPHEGLHAPDLQARHHAVQDVLLRSTHAAVAPVDRHPAAQCPRDALANHSTLVRYNRHRCILFQAIDHEIEGSGKGIVARATARPAIARTLRTANVRPIWW